jgi:hypothetical protein
MCRVQAIRARRDGWSATLRAAWRGVLVVHPGDEAERAWWWPRQIGWRHSLKYRAFSAQSISWSPTRAIIEAPPARERWKRGGGLAR